MPRAAKTKTPDPGSIYVCWQSGSAEVDGETYAFVRGQRLRGDNPVVRGVPWAFVPDGTPQDLMPSHWDEIVRRHEAENPPGPQVDVFLVDEPRPLEREDVIVLTRPVLVGWGHGTKGTTTFEKGAVFGARSELAAALPDDAYEAEPGVQFTRLKGRRR
jgi:hypothetical protein